MRGSDREFSQSSAVRSKNAAFVFLTDQNLFDTVDCIVNLKYLNDDQTIPK